MPTHPVFMTGVTIVTLNNEVLGYKSGYRRSLALNWGTGSREAPLSPEGRVEKGEGSRGSQPRDGTARIPTRKRQARVVRLVQCLRMSHRGCACELSLNALTDLGYPRATASKGQGQSAAPLPAGGIAFVSVSELARE
jgi:hypothetical protein